MAGENNVASLNGLFKTVYSNKLVDLIPDYAILQKLVEFGSADKETGNFYAQPVVLAQEAGFTFNGTAGAVKTLTAARAGTMKEAQVYGYEVLLRAQISYIALSRSAAKGEKAFKRASSVVVEGMNNAMRKQLEVSMLYGQVGVGTVSSLSSQVITLTDASWAGGIWAGAEGRYIDVYQSNKSTVRQAGLKISAVDSDNKALTVVGTTTGIVSTDVIFFEDTNNSGTFNEMAGLQKIITNTSTLFNIDASAYALWKGNSISSVGQISHGKLQDAVSKAVNKGLMEKVAILLSPKAWAVLNTDQAALRQFDSSYSTKKLENGGEALCFYGSNGAMEVHSHPLVKDGDCFIVPMDTVQRIGSTDLTFSVPGMEEDFFQLVPNTNAVELQCMADQAIFLEKPAHAIYLSGLTYA
jgi:hypothetical protein